MVNEFLALRNIGVGDILGVPEAGNVAEASEPPHNIEEDKHADDGAQNRKVGVEANAKELDHVHLSKDLREDSFLNSSHHGEVVRERESETREVTTFFFFVFFFS